MLYATQRTGGDNLRSSSPNPSHLKVRVGGTRQRQHNSGIRCRFCIVTACCSHDIQQQRVRLSRNHRLVFWFVSSTWLRDGHLWVSPGDDVDVRVEMTMTILLDHCRPCFTFLAFSSPSLDAWQTSADSSPSDASALVPTSWPRAIDPVVERTSVSMSSWLT